MIGQIPLTRSCLATTTGVSMQALLGALRRYDHACRFSQTLQ
jgi:hypothetical protein